MLKNFCSAVLRLFFNYLNSGYECVVCGKRTYIFPVCKGCTNEHFNVTERMLVKRCRICGKELFSCNEVCLQCRENAILKHVDFALSLFSYRLWNRELMFMWKSSGIRALSDFFAKSLAEALLKMDVCVIVPVPPRPGKIKEKGWDQIDELTSILKYRYGFKVFDVLERKTTGEQKKLDRNERLDTIGKSYFLKDEKLLKKTLKKFNDIIPERVCVLDDVCTTGSTLESCAALLKSMNVKEVHALTLFTVD